MGALQPYWQHNCTVTNKVIMMSDSNCLFCKIATKEVSSTIVYEDNHIVAFKDIAPQMPIHIVLIPKIHIPGLNELTNDSADIVAHIVIKAKELATKFNIGISGYRLVSNCGPDAGQSVHHLHFHLLGGAPMPVDLA